MFKHSTITKIIKTVFRLLINDRKLLLAKILSRGKPPLFLYQMGKVASKTHERTLNHLYFVQHLHDQIEFDPAYAKGCRKYTGSQYFPHDIITATRDPLSRKISVFFQNITSDIYGFSYKSQDEVKKASIEDLVRRFKEWDDGIKEATGWFDKHFSPKTGIDIYASKFDTEQGWQLLESEKFRVLIVKFEDIKKNHVEALNALLEKRFESKKKIDRLVSQDSSFSEVKWYSAVLKEFKETIKFSNEELDEAYCSKYMLHFYSTEQIAKLRAKWE